MVSIYGLVSDGEGKKGKVVVAKGSTDGGCC